MGGFCLLYSRIWQAAEYLHCYISHCAIVVTMFFCSWDIYYQIWSFSSILLCCRIQRGTVLTLSRNWQLLKRFSFHEQEFNLKKIFTIAAKLCLDTWKKCLPRNMSKLSFSQQFAKMHVKILGFFLFWVQCCVLYALCMCITNSKCYPPVACSLVGMLGLGKVSNTTATWEYMDISIFPPRKYFKYLIVINKTF